jgi:hypothetical protein
MQLINSSLNNLRFAAANNMAINAGSVKKTVNPFSSEQLAKQPIGEKQGKPSYNEQGVDNKPAQQIKVKSTQLPQSFELDEATLAFLQGTQTQYQSVQSQGSGFFSDSNEFIVKDYISRQNISAVSSYQAISNLAQRESVQKLLGVDLYA